MATKQPMKPVTVRLPDRIHMLAEAGAREAEMSLSSFLCGVIERQLLGHAPVAETTLPTTNQDAREARNLAGAAARLLADLTGHVQAALPLSGPQAEQASQLRKAAIARLNQILEAMDKEDNNG